MTHRQPTTRPGWWRLLLAAIAALVVGLLSAGTASAATVPDLETRVGASTPVAAYVVGVHESVSAGQRWGTAPPTAVIASATGVAANTAAKFCSFAGATLVVMADGSRKPIDQVKVGDKVQATDPESGETEARAVTETWVHQDTLVDLQVEGGAVVTTTEDHPFWSVTDQRFERADELTAGDQILSADGQRLTVRGLVPGSQRRATAYNLTIEGIHTYFVGIGNSSALVHNTCAWALDALSQSGARLVGKDLTRAGQKLAQHGGQGNFPVPKGSPSAISRMGQDQLDDILTAPGTVARDINGGNFAGGRYYVSPDGRGAAFDANGVFQYFGVFAP